MATGSAHLCRCTIVTIVLLFIVSVGLVIGAFNIDTFKSLLNINTVEPRNVTARTHVYSEKQVQVNGDVTINIGLANYNATAFAGNQTTAPIVLLLHGWLEDYRLCWADVMNQTEMTTQWTYIMPDLVGSGNSTKPAESNYYTLTSMATQLGLVVNETTNSRPVHVVGIEYGGILAYTFASMFPQMVRSLTVFNAPHPLVLETLIQSVPDQRNRSVDNLLRWLSPQAEENLRWNTFEALRRHINPSSNGNATFFRDNEARYINLWETTGPGPSNYLAATLNWWQANILLNGDTFSNQSTVNVPRINNATMSLIAAPTRAYFASNQTLWSMPLASNQSPRYIQPGKWIPTGSNPAGNNWIHHTAAKFVAGRIQQAVLAPN